jgi:DNA invertase Pin-like site-specific DNA recombinase
VESGKRAERPELTRALAECRVRKATLVIAKLGRLARDAHFLLRLQRSDIAFTAADMPNDNRLTVGIMAMVAEEERRALSERTKAALAAAKAPVIEAIRAEGITSATGIAKALNERGIPTARSGKWQAVQGAEVRRARAAARDGENPVRILL